MHRLAKTLRRTFVIASIAGLCGCGCAFAQITAAPALGPTPNYRAIIAKSLRQKTDSREQGEVSYFTARGGIFPPAVRVDHVEISDSIKEVQTNFHGWAWQTCLRLNVNEVAAIYAVFIADGRVVDARPALALDKCEHATYAPLRRGATVH